MAYLEEYQKWMKSPALSDAERVELAGIVNDEKEIKERFFAPLEFGTGGLRGVMEAGLRRMNHHTVRWTTQAFANLILEEGEEAAQKGVAIAYDCRNNSEAFAKDAASVLAANGIKVKLFDGMRPTPELSFAIREYGCIAGVNVTASHNPKEYNGYKVYWDDGAQLPPHHADKISNGTAAIDIFKDVKTMPFDEALKAGMVEILGDAADARFLDLCKCQSVGRDGIMPQIKALKLVYTPFHGTGYKLVPRIFADMGFENVLCVQEQMIPDGDFPTVKSPNPEEPEGFALAVKLARENDVDVIIGTDPDADRVGVMVRDKHGEYQVLSGNQTGVLLLDYIIRARKEAGTMPRKPVAVKSVVSTNMARAVAEAHGVEMHDTFTGFKFLAEFIGKLPPDKKYIFAFEESFGYLAGDHARDKDAVTASMLVAEMAAWHKKRGDTLRDALDGLYRTYGHYKEKTMSIVMPGADGLEKMGALMEKWREDPPGSMGGITTLAVRDYKTGERYVLSGHGGMEDLDISGSDVLYFEMEDGTTLIVRPSGTEPKMKVYILAKGQTNAECDAKIEHYITCAKMMVR